MSTTAGQKGYDLEELLRAYFLRAGVYAVRGVPLKLEGDDLTDVDLWLYERPTGSSRRRQIVDAKSKNKPKAVERLLWTKGLCELLAIDGAYVATTDTRPLLKEMSHRLGISVLDGTDIKRMSDSEKVLFQDRMPEESLQSRIRDADKQRRSKEFQNNYADLKAALIDNFGSGTVNRALEHVSGFGRMLLASHPNTANAEISLRLFYIAASICAISLDFSLTKVSFKSSEERRRIVLNVIRYGEDDESRGLEKVRIATALIERYAQNGRVLARNVAQSIRDDYAKIPAEIIADYVLKNLRPDGLFSIARSLEAKAYIKDLVGFDNLSPEEKSFLGALMDFTGLDRAAIAKGWKSIRSSATASDKQSGSSEPEIGPLFDPARDGNESG